MFTGTRLVTVVHQYNVSIRHRVHIAFLATPRDNNMIMKHTVYTLTHYMIRTSRDVFLRTENLAPPPPTPPTLLSITVEV